ncbi:MAG TPA: NFACT family protein [Candidatus Nanoarchaeia archaeon]|nr:NFACT family protein [Candidatus Nanoarchaeia archaeon]
MPKKSISSLELAALVNELGFLRKGKISQIYHQGKGELVLQLHAPGQGKKLLKVFPGKFMCLIPDKADSPLRPSGFCMQLRKYIDNAFIKDIYQLDSERIVIFELEKSQKFFLVIEFYSKGNLILTDNNLEIIATLNRQIWKDRVIKANEKYELPKSKVNWKKLTEKELQSVFKTSQSKNLAQCLAAEVGLGGLYAEEVSLRTKIDKNKLPAELNLEEIEIILKGIQHIVKTLDKPRGYIYEEEITPLPLIGKKELKVTSTYNEAINTIKLNEVVSPYDQQIKKLKRTLALQEEAIARLDDKIKINTHKGELIYEKYAPLQKLLEIVKQLRRIKNWEEVASELKKEKKIRTIDLKNKKVAIEL